MVILREARRWEWFVVLTPGPRNPTSLWDASRHRARSQEGPRTPYTWRSAYLGVKIPCWDDATPTRWRFWARPLNAGSGLWCSNPTQGTLPAGLTRGYRVLRL